MKELIKKVELSKSEGPHYLLLLKHLSPIHNLKYAKEIEEKNYIKILKKYSEFREEIKKEGLKSYLKEETKHYQRCIKVRIQHVAKNEVP